MSKINNSNYENTTIYCSNCNKPAKLERLSAGYLSLIHLRDQQAPNSTTCYRVGDFPDQRFCNNGGCNEAVEWAQIQYSDNTTGGRLLNQGGRAEHACIFRG